MAACYIYTDDEVEMKSEKLWGRQFFHILHQWLHENCLILDLYGLKMPLPQVVVISLWTNWFPHSQPSHSWGYDSVLDHPDKQMECSAAFLQIFISTNSTI